MMREISIALQCGHTSCNKCYEQLIINNARDNNNNLNNGINVAQPIQCPTCRTPCNTYIQLFL